MPNLRVAEIRTHADRSWASPMAMAEIGARCGDRSFRAFFEAHIEQGPILEREHKAIGAVLGGDRAGGTG